MLILFDIDGTLITSRAEVSDGGSRDGVGTASMIEAGRNLFGSHFTLDGVEIAGRLDALIWRDAAIRNGVPNHEGEHERFRAEYARILRRRLQAGAPVRLLPGVRELVPQLAAIEAFTLGLLTGNYPETGRMKLHAAGLNTDVFAVGAWGCDGDSRRALPPIALRAHRERSGFDIDPQQVVIIGDTPHDIDCAQANGCRSIGVATGKFSVAELSACGAELTVDNLADTPSLLNWLMDARSSIVA